MSKKKLTKKQQAEMLYKAVMIAEGSEDPTPEMSYVEAWQHLVDTGECWKLQGFFGRAAHRMLADGTLRPPPTEEQSPQNDGDDE